MTQPEQPENNSENTHTLSDEINLRTKADRKRADTAKLAEANKRPLGFKL